MGRCSDIIQAVAHRAGFHISRYPTLTEFELALKRVLQRYRINVVLDVGANQGQYAEHLRSLAYAGRIVSFEPVSATFLHLERVARDDPNWIVHRTALGSVQGSASMRISADSVFNSFLDASASAAPKFREHLSVVSEQEVQVQRLDAVFDDCIAGVNRPSVLLKTDTQGFDLEVIRGAGIRIHEIQVLQVEIAVRPIYDGMPPFAAMVEMLGEMGFGLVALAPVSRDETGQVVEYDGLFQRSSDATPGVVK